MLLVLTSRRREEDEHWWDRDPHQRAKNLRWEAALEGLLVGGHPPQKPEGGSDMPAVVAAALKYGLTPVLLAWLIWMGVTEFRGDLRASRTDLRDTLRSLERHSAETTIRMDQMDQNQERVVNLLRAQCLNAAKNYQERRDCVQAGQ